MIYNILGIGDITDNTNDASGDVLLLKTNQNSKYIKKERNTITPFELIEKLDFEEIQIIGLCGTNGKTTTANIVSYLLNNLECKTAMQGTQGFFVEGKAICEKSLTTPSILHTISNIEKAKELGCKIFVMEVSSHGIHQQRIEGLKFFIKCFTNISQDHLDYHKTYEEYKKVKESFFKDSSIKVINVDEEFNFNRQNSFSYSLSQKSDFKVSNTSFIPQANSTITFLEEEALLGLKIIGEFNLYNSLCAISCVKLITNKKLEEIVKVMNTFGGVSGRVELVSKNPMVIVDFAHTPDGIEKVLKSLNSKKLVVLFGAGGDRDKSKRELMGKAVSIFSSRAIITNDNPRFEEPIDIIKDIEKGMSVDYNIIEDRKEAITYALAHLQKDEILVLLGKGDEEYIYIKGEKIPFSDKEVVLEII